MAETDWKFRLRKTRARIKARIGAGANLTRKLLRTTAWFLFHSASTDDNSNKARLHDVRCIFIAVLVLPVTFVVIFVYITLDLDLSVDLSILSWKHWIAIYFDNGIVGAISKKSYYSRVIFCARQKESEKVRKEKKTAFKTTS